MTPPWYPALGASGGGGAPALLLSRQERHELAGAAFWCPTTGSWLAVGRIATATATASDAKPDHRERDDRVPISSDRRLSFSGPVSASGS